MEKESEKKTHWKHCIEAFLPYLEEQVLPDICKVIALKFLLLEIFTEEQYRDVCDAVGHCGNRLFWTYFIGSIDNYQCYFEFSEILKSQGFGYVLDVIEGNRSDSFVILNLWKKTLADNYLKFINEFNSQPILDFHGPFLFDITSLEIIKSGRSTVVKNTLFLFHLSKKPNWLPKFVDALKDSRCGNNSHLVECLDPDGKLHGYIYVQLIELLKPEIKNSLNIDDILDKMHTISQESKKSIKCTKENKLEKFFQIMTSQELEWFEDFKAALCSCGDKYLKLLNLIDPDHSKPSKFKDSLLPTTSTMYNRIDESGFKDNEDAPLDSSSQNQQLAEENSPQNINRRAFLPEEDHNIENILLPCINDIERESQPSRLSSESSDVDSSIISCEKHETEVSEKPILKLRDYQEELAEQALKGENCMIVAPTGSGKTYVALKICMDHLEKTENPKIIFLVPKVPLVKQQFNLFTNYIKDDEKLFQVTGDTVSNVPVHKSVQESRLNVMTAQILVNLFRDGLMTVSDITLLIFDECHHTVKGEPYNQIMGMYLDLLLKDNNVKLPQVVGLTASPGMGKAKIMKQAEDNLLMLMANLDVSSPPVQVNIQRDNLRKFQNEALDNMEVVPRGNAGSFTKNIKKAMSIIECKIQHDIDKYKEVLEKRIQFDLRAARGTQDYEAWAVDLLNKSKLIKHEESSQRFMTYADHLRVYNNSLMLNDHVRNIDSKNYIRSVLLKEEARNDIELEMRSIYLNIEPILERSNDPNPLLSRLKALLDVEFCQNVNSRCIIFVKTRAIARALLDYLKEEEDLKRHDLNPNQLTGAAARRDNFGMTKVGQDDNLSKFRDGKCKVLVATSVAEEGLDIKECNLIISYNYSTNEVGKIQRKGRGRAEKSKVITLAYDDSGHVKREKENAIRVKLIQDLLDKIRQMPKKELKDRIREIQKKQKKDRDFDKAFQDHKSQIRKPNAGPFKLQCIWCKKLVTTSDKFRIINKQHRVVVDKDFNKRATFKEVPESEAKQCGDEQFLIGKAFCKNEHCQRVWGLRMRYKKFPISVLRIENFLIIGDGGYRAVKKKWKDAPFEVRKKLTLDDLIESLDVYAHQYNDAEDMDDDSDLDIDIN